MITLDLSAILIISLASWRTAYMLTTEAGMFDMFVFIRKYANVGGVLNCIFCFSVWTSAILVLVWYTDLYPAIYILAVSAVAIIIHQIVKALQALHFYVLGDD